jgi:hypothetical protein
MNLSSLGSFSSLATNALDTARSTFKGLADAAIDSGSSATETAGNKPSASEVAAGEAAQKEAAQKKAAEKAETKRPEAKSAEAKLASKSDSSADTAETKFKGRLGTLLDAYA